MASVMLGFIRNWPQNDTTSVTRSVETWSGLFPNAKQLFQEVTDWQDNGHEIIYWEQTSPSNKQGTLYQPYDTLPSGEGNFKAIWSYPYTDQNTPIVESITLPSGNEYYIADREARNEIEDLRAHDNNQDHRLDKHDQEIDDLQQQVAGGVSFIIAWNGTSVPVPANIPAGVKVVYNDVEYTGTKVASANDAGKFYLISSGTSAGQSDTYDEYVAVKTGETSYAWQKIGDTQIDLTDVVTDVSLTKTSSSVIGSNSTFTITQPTIALATDTNSGTGKVQVATDASFSLDKDVVNPLNSLGSPSTKNAIGANSTFTITQPTVTLSTGTTGDITVVTGGITKRMTASASGTDVTATTTNIKATASGGGAAWNSKDSKTVLTGVKVTAQPAVALSSGADGDVSVATGIGAATTKYLTASASGTAVTASGDSITVLTNGTPTSDSAVKSVTPTTKKLATTTVIGVQSTTTTASKATAGTTQTTATGAGTTSTTNTDWLKGVSVNNGSLIIGAATMNTQNTTQFTFSDVTVPVKNASATTVGTGAITTSGSGADVVTDVAVGDTITALTGLGTIGTDTVLGTSTSFGVTQPTITLTENSSSTTGAIQYVKTQGTATTTKLSATASGTTVGADGTASVIGASSTFTNTQPTIALATGATAGTGVISVATGIDTVTQPTITLSDTASSGGVQFIQSLTSTKAKATATGANTAWNSKDTVAAVTGYPNTTTVAVLGEDTDVTGSATKTYIKATATGANTAWNNKDTKTVANYSDLDVNVTKGS